MKVLTQPDGTFAFVFAPDEKKLGVDLLLCIHPRNEEEAAAIQAAIRQIKYAGMEVPDNVYTIH